MDSFLQSASREGRHDSAGVFTVDLARARAKLGQYQLARFEEFPRFLLSAAVASGASELRFQIETVGSQQTRCTKVAFDGWSLSEEELQGMLFGELAAGDHKAKKYLAMVLSALASKEPVVMATAQSGTTFAVEVKKDKVSSLPDYKLFSAGDTLQLVFSCNWNYELFSTQALKSRWLPLPVTLDGQRINGTVNRGVFTENFLRGYWTRGTDSPTVDLSSDKLLQLEPAPGEPSSLILIGYESKPTFKLVLDGMAFDLPKSMALTGVSGFLLAPELRTDLSFQNLVRNSALERVGPVLRAKVASVLKLLASETTPIDQKYGLLFWPLIDELRGEHEMDSVEAGLLRRMGKLAPTIEPGGVAALLRRTEKIPDSERDRLFSGYWAHAAERWRLHDHAKSIQYLKTCEKLKVSVNLPGKAESDLAELLALYASGKAALHPQHPWHSYFAGLCQWIHTGSPSELLAAEPHPGWLLPVTLFGEMAGGVVEWSEVYPHGLPAWLDMWRCLQTADLDGATSLLESTGELEGESRGRDWHEVLWKAMNGKVSFFQSVKLRARLSLLQFKMPGSDLPANEGLAARNACRKYTAREGNWPLFFWLLLTVKSTGILGDRAARSLWLKIMLDLAVAEEFAHPGARERWKEPVQIQWGASCGEGLGSA